MVNVSKALIIAILLSPVLAHGQAKEPDMVLGTINNNYDLFTPAEVVSAGGGGGGGSLPNPPASGKFLYEANDSALNWRGITGIVIDALPPMAGKANNCVKVNSTANGLRYADCGSPRVLSNRDPVLWGTAAPGTRTDVSRADHKHPAQSIRQVPNPSGVADGSLLTVQSNAATWATPSTSIGRFLATPQAGDRGDYLRIESDLSNTPYVQYVSPGDVLSNITPSNPSLTSEQIAALVVDDKGTFKFVEDHALVTAGLPALSGQAGNVLTVAENATGVIWAAGGGGGGGGGECVFEEEYNWLTTLPHPVEWVDNAPRFFFPLHPGSTAEQHQFYGPATMFRTSTANFDTEVFFFYDHASAQYYKGAFKLTHESGETSIKSFSYSPAIADSFVLKWVVGKLVCGGGGGGGGDLGQTAGVSFKLFEQAELTVTDISTDTMLPITQTVIAETEFTSGLVGGPFFTNYEGAITLTVTANKSITATLTTTHTFNDSTTLTTTRTAVYRLNRNTETTINLADFTSITNLPVGATFVNDQGTTITIDENLLAQPVDIETTLKLSASGNTTVTQMGSERPKVTWYQLNPGTGGNPVLPAATPGGASKALRVNAAGTSYELVDFPATVAPANTAPGGVKSGSPVIGTSTKYAREDHQHTFSLYGSSIPKNPALGGGGSSGTSTLAARTDHIHPSIVPSLTSNKGKYLQVNTAEDGIEWADLPGGTTPAQVAQARLEAIRASATYDFTTRWGGSASTGVDSVFRNNSFRELPIKLSKALANTENEPANLQPIYIAVSWPNTDGTRNIHEYVSDSRHLSQLGECTPGQTIAQCHGSEEFDTGGWRLSKTSGDLVMLAAPTTLAQEVAVTVTTNLPIGPIVYQTVSNTWQNWQAQAGVWDKANGVGMIRTSEAKALWDWINNGMISQVSFTTESTRGSGANERQSFSGCVIKIPNNKFLSEDTQDVFSCFATIVDLANWGVQFTLANYGKEVNNTVVWTNVYLHNFNTDGQANIALTIEAAQ